MPKIITAHTGTPHITADDVGALLKAAIGNNDYLLSDTPETFTAKLLDNNTLQLSNAEVVLQGTHIRIQATDKVTIEQGQNGMKRIDFVVCRYSKDDNGIENAEIAVVKGTPSISPNAPVVTQCDIRNGATIHEMPLFKVEIEGFAITAITNVCYTLNSLHSALQSIAGLQSANKTHSISLSNITLQLSQLSGKVFENIASINAIKANNLLWSGALYMNANHSITIPSIANQTNGIILVFSYYTNGESAEREFQCFFVPKYLISKQSGNGHRFTMVYGLLSSFCVKYLYITNTTIKGHENNNKSGTASSGVKYNNANFVLRYVIGI